MSNPSNPVSPVNPTNPASPIAPVQATAPVQQSVTQVMSNPVASPVTNNATVTAPTAQPTQTTVEPPKGITQKPVIAKVLDLEQKTGKSLVQTGNSFPTATINQEIPLEIRQNNKFLMDILSSGSITESVRINQITKDTVEYEQ